MATRRSSPRGELETPIGRVLSRLEGVQAGSGDRSWMALCPAHDDSTLSLHVTVNDDGDVGVYCHGGCPKAICRAVLVLMGETSSSASRA